MVIITTKGCGSFLSPTSRGVSRAGVSMKQEMVGLKIITL